jgi:hypothetical protein
MVNQKYRFYNVGKGTYELPNTFTTAQEFRNGMAIVGVDGKFGVINDKGLFLVPALYEAIDYEFLNGKYIFYVKLNGKTGVQGMDGKLIVPCDYDLLVTSDAKFFKAKKNGKYGVLKINGQECVEFKYAFLSNGKESVGVPEWPCISSDGKRVGLIDTKGEELIKPIYDQIFYIGEGLYGYQKKKDVGIVRANGVMVVDGDFSELKPFIDKIAMAKKGEKWGYIALGGKFFIQPIYEEVSPFVKNTACVKLDGLWGIIDKSGKVLRKPEYEDFKDFGSGDRRMFKAGKEYKVDELGVLK